jgi:hypothetical protein
MRAVRLLNRALIEPEEVTRKDALDRYSVYLLYWYRRTDTDAASVPAKAALEAVEAETPGV